MFPRPKGFTLIETLVASAVVSLLLGAIYFSLIYGFRQLRQTVAYSDVQQQAQLAIRSLKDDLGETNFAKVDLAVDRVAMISPRGLRDQPNSELYTYTGAGLLQYRSWVGYYRTTGGELRRAQIDVNPDVVLPDPIVAPAPAAFAAVTGPLVKTVARDLSLFQVTPDASIQTLSIAVTVRKAVNSTRRTELSLTAQVRARH